MKRKRNLVDRLNLVMAALFVLFAVVQYNDPDPALWMVIYSVAAVLCVLYRLGRLPRVAALLFGALMGVLAVYLAYRIVSLGQFFFDEEGREMLGALLVAGWMGVLYGRGRS